MSSFVPPFDPAQASSPVEVRATLPDPPSTGAVVRPGVARYARADLTFLKVTLAGGSLAAPAAGTVRLIPNVSLDGSDRTLVELSPLPFAMVPVLRGLGAAGLPTFYLWANGVNVQEHAFVAAGAALAPAGSGPAYVGVVFQDGVDSPPWSWIERLSAAMTAAGENAAVWNGLNVLQPAAARVLAVDHAGRPLGAGASFEVRTAPPTGPFGAPVTVALSADSDLASVPGVNLFPTDGSRVEVRWAPGGTSQQPLQALSETRQGTAPGGWLPLSQAALPSRRGRIQVLDADRWFAPRPADLPIPMQRFHAGSRLEPLVDGHETYRRLVTDLRASARPADGGGPFGAHLAGWAFRDFALIADDETSHGIALLEQILGGGGQARVLINKILMLEDEDAFLDTLGGGLALLLMLPLVAEALSERCRRLVGEDVVGYIAQLSARALAAFVLVNLQNLPFTSNILNELAEDGLRFFNAANALSPGIALLSRHPARLGDNPIADPDAFTGSFFDLTDLIDRIGTWHNKFQVVRRGTDANEPNEHIAYLGGIDINTNRMDNPGHQTAAPYHDVHARVTGPAASDVFRSFAERWEFDRAAEGGTVTPALVTPQPASLPVQPAGHVVMIGRTYLRRNAASQPPLPFAPTGEKTIHDSLLRAVTEAKEYIYIEDQYFTPPSGTAGIPNLAVYFDTLEAASDHCRRLIHVGPTGGGGQPFGLDRRRILLNRLADAWGDRFIAGAPFRRPYLPPANRSAHKGRCLLYQDVSAGNDELLIGPRIRVPEAPFWLWIDGEVMLAREAESGGTVDDVPVSRVEVLRAGIAGADWGVLVRPHKKGAPVTMAQIASIFVHAKITIIDDVFLTIGSANMNRRGFFHDGEINAFAVPQALRAAPDNPARRLRTLLWAEHLGLPPAMGPALLGDPIAAFDLFRRTRSEGQRLVPFNQVDVDFQLGLSEDSNPALALMKGFLGVTAELLTPTIWNTLIDPPTLDDVARN
ncbi:MAG TPA: phospholipase D-like domain-containing protein, partial [Thermoanaerobaculia bacterium]|nr:phospholipase D-like domain-containing protein [Thermoanaerobaculia bacterium]